MTSPTKALLAIVGASLLWSTAGLSKIVILALDPYMAAFLRFLVASIVILPFFLKEKRGQKPITPLILLSLGSTANIAFFYIGLQTSTANASALIYAGVPLLTAVLAHKLIGEAITTKKIVGILVGLIGVAFIAILPALEKGQVVSGGFPGNFFFIAAVVSWTLYLIASRRIMSRHGYSPVELSSVSIFTTCIIFFIISLFTFRTSYIPRMTDPAMIFYILHLGIGVTVGTYLLLQLAIKLSSASTTSLTNYLQPVFALLFNAVFLKETITLQLIAGIVLVFTGITISSGAHVLKEVRSWTKK